VVSFTLPSRRPPRIFRGAAIDIIESAAAGYEPVDQCPAHFILSFNWTTLVLRADQWRNIRRMLGYSTTADG